MSRNVKRVYLHKWEKSHNEKRYHCSLRNLNFSEEKLLVINPGNPKYIVLMSLTLSLLSKDLKAGGSAAM